MPAQTSRVFLIHFRSRSPSHAHFPAQNAEPYGEEALQYTKEKCLQHDVKVTIEEMDKAGNFIGWLFIENENLSVALVEHGLASMHHTAEASEFFRAIKSAEEGAIKRRIGIWKDYVEVEKEAEDKKNAPVQDRTVKYEKVCRFASLLW